VASSILETVLFLFIVYLVLSLMTSVTLGYIQDLLKLRANYLEDGIENMFMDRRLTRMIFEHPLIRALGTGSNRKPSYIPADVFSAVVFDILDREATNEENAEKKIAKREKFDAIYSYVNGMNDRPEARVLLLTVLNESTGSIAKARLELEELYNRVVDRISGGYRQRAKLLGMVVAIVLAVMFNADTILMAKFSFTDRFIGTFPIGWVSVNIPVSLIGWIQKVFGILLTALAAATIFPLWYDLPRMLFRRTQSNQQREVAATIEILQNARTEDVQLVAANQIKLLNDYYKIVLDQSRKSFSSALVAAIIGLGFFLGAVLSVMSSETINLALISGVAGAIVEVISGVNFYLYGKTTIQMADFQSRLDMTQRFLLANSICENLDWEAKQTTRSQLVLKIVDANVMKPVAPPAEKTG